MMDGNPSSGAACDMMVLLPNDVSGLESQLQIKDIMNRLASTGFTHMALTHTIYGRPRPIEDRAEVAIPKSLWMGSKDNAETTNNKEPSTKRQKTTNETSSRKPPLRVLRRLHAVLENLSDVGVYLSNGPNASLLNEYDLVSVSPRNEATFQSACASATVADIITLDYTTRGIRLPYRIRSSDVKAVIDRQAAFEIPFAPALLHGKQRKALVSTCRDLQTSSLGTKPCILFSSGDRTFEESDVGAMAMRMPGDLSNILQTVLHFDPSTSLKAVGASGLAVLKRAEDRRWGKSDVGDVVYEVKGEEENVAAEPVQLDSEKTNNQTLSRPTQTNTKEEDSDEGIEDGFITMT
jgi:ribonuclease P/MRP protein subunit RPP1